MATILRDDYTAVYRTGTLHKISWIGPLFRQGRRVDGDGYMARCGIRRHVNQWRDGEPKRHCKVCFPEDHGTKEAL